MKVKILIYKKMSKINQEKQWEMYKERINEIIQKPFESYQKDELYQLCLETYSRVMPCLVMSPFDFGKT